MDYPAGRHEVQVLDDSTDGTRAVVDEVAAELRAHGHDVKVVRRPQREHYKAGALAYGLDAGHAASSSRSSTPISCRTRLSCGGMIPLFATRPGRGRGAGPLGAPERRTRAGSPTGCRSASTCTSRSSRAPATGTAC